MSNIVEVTDLRKSYADTEAVRGVSFAVQKGEIFGILGPNGAGKTTTLEMLEALRPIDGGKAMINGINVAEDPDKIKLIIGVQRQSSAFLSKLKLTEQLELFAGLYGTKINPKKLLAEVQLEDKANSYVENMSGGQQQRFSIAAALVHTPKVLFLDEPTTGLDPQARRNLWDLIRDINKKGVTVVMTSHYMEEAQLLCDRVAVMDAGKIVALDSPKNLIKQLLAKGFKKKVEVQQADLEDVFIDITGKALRD